MKIVNL